MKLFRIILAISIVAVMVIILLQTNIRRAANENGTNNKKYLPSIIIKDLDGKEIEFKKLFTGKITLLNFWATWCPPCRKEIPMFEEYYKKYKDKGFDIVAASVDRDMRDVISFKKDNNMSFKVIMANEKLLSHYGGIRSIPTTFLLDEEGQIKNKFIGFNPQIEEEIKKYLGVK